MGNILRKLVHVNFLEEKNSTERRAQSEELRAKRKKSRVPVPLKRSEGGVGLAGAKVIVCSCISLFADVVPSLLALSFYPALVFAA